MLILGGLFWTTTRGGVVPVVIRTDGDEKRRRKREQEQLDAYREKQARLRAQLEAAYARETGEDLSAGEIQSLLEPPKPAARIIRQLRRVETQIALVDPVLVQRMQDDEDALIILLLS